MSDPRNPLHAPWVARNFALWERIIVRARGEDRDWFTATPEFGPADYMPLRGIDPDTVADPWEINLWMRDELRRRFGPAG